VATNADHWHPDFILKLRITFHPPLAPALGLGILAGASASGPAVRPDSAVRIGQAVARATTSPIQLGRVLI
jgi:hypothetical protein